MNECLCCTKNLPATLQKVCPLCGQEFKGQGWWGVDSHWKARHEGEMPYAEFWEGLCDLHRSSASDGAKPRQQASPTSDPVENAYTKALFHRSSHVENILTHAMVAAIGQELWRRSPELDLQVFNAEVDDSGFDLVLGCGGSMRYIQIKQTHLRGKAIKYSLRQDFAQMVGGCAVVLVYGAETLEIDHCLFYGGGAGETMSPIEHLPMTQSPGRRTAEGVRKIREHYRDVPRRSFQGPLSISELVDCLFPGASGL